MSAIHAPASLRKRDWKWGPMPINALLPPVSVFVTSVLVLLPWGLGDGVRFVLPLIPLLSLHYWELRQPHAMPASVAFAAGLAHDVVMQGPVGLWALLFLAALAIARATAPFAGASGPLGRLALTAVTLAVIVAGEWAVGSIYYVRILDWRPMILAGLAALVIYPVLAIVLAAVARLAGQGRPRMFARGN